MRSALLLAIAIVFQILGRTFPQISQFLVGPVVNALLILACCICGLWYGVLVGALTPLLAWLVGQLAAPFGPFIPFIMIGNALFIIVFNIFNSKQGLRTYIGVILGAIIKFGFLFFSASKLVKLFALNLPEKVANKLIIAMGIPQLITALIGGILAIFIYKLLVKRDPSLEGK